MFDVAPLFKTNGQIGRGQFFWTYLTAKGIASIAYRIENAMFSPDDYSTPAILMSYVAFFIAMAALVSIVTLVMRRLRDIGINPYFVSIWIIILLADTFVSWTFFNQIASDFDDLSQPAIIVLAMNLLVVLSVILLMVWPTSSTPATTEAKFSSAQGTALLNGSGPSRKILFGAGKRA